MSEHEFSHQLIQDSSASCFFVLRDAWFGELFSALYSTTSADLHCTEDARSASPPVANPRRQQRSPDARRPSGGAA